MPDTYSIPDPPEGVTRVRPTDDSGRSFTLNTEGVYRELWKGSDGGTYTWTQVLDKFGEVEPVPLTELESAVAHFRSKGIPDELDDMDLADWIHARVILDDVVSRG